MQNEKFNRLIEKLRKDFNEYHIIENISVNDVLYDNSIILKHKTDKSKYLDISYHELNMLIRVQKFIKSQETIIITHVSICPMDAVQFNTFFAFLENELESLLNGRI